VSTYKRCEWGWYESAARRQCEVRGIDLGERKCSGLRAVSSDPDRKKFAPAGVTEVHFTLTDGLIKRGAWKGTTKWVKGTTMLVYVTDVEHREAITTFERETGECHNCEAGQEFARWSEENGNETRPCRKCNGTGRVPTSEATDNKLPREQQRTQRDEGQAP
jgi:hypothetical protein